MPSGQAGHSGGTAGVSREEGGDDVKSARPLRPGLHTCYNGRYRGSLLREEMPISKAYLSSDWRLKPASMKLDSLVIAHQPWRGEYAVSYTHLDVYKRQVPDVNLHWLLTGIGDAVIVEQELDSSSIRGENTAKDSMIAELMTCLLYTSLKGKAVFRDYRIISE